MPYVEGVLTDVVLNSGGVPVQGATVQAYLVSSFGNGVLPTTPGAAPLQASATTDSTGTFSLRNLAADDYHLYISYTPPGGIAVTLWRYNVSVGPQGAVSRALRRGSVVGHRRALAKLVSGQSVHIQCIGDGVTVGYNATGTVSGGYVALLASKLAAGYASATVTRYDPTSYGSTTDAPIPSWASTTVQTGSGTAPQVITVSNAGVTGDSALRCLRRLANFGNPTWFPPPDVYCVLLGTAELSGDPTLATDAATFYAHLVGLVNVLRASGAEVILLTPVASASANLDVYAGCVRQAAAELGCSLVDTRQAWLDQYVSGASNDGYGTWLNTSGGDHQNPTDAGHAAIAAELYKAFDLGSDAPVIGGLIDSGQALERVLLKNSDARLAFTGTWTTFAAGSFQGGAGLASGQEKRTSTAGDHITFSVRCTELYMLCRRWHDAGQVSVTVDSAPLGTVDLYRAYPTSTVDLADFNGALMPQDRVLLVQGLTDAVHSVTLQLSASNNPLSSGFLWRFDAVEALRVRHRELDVAAPVAGQAVAGGQASAVLAAAASASVAVTFPAGVSFAAAPAVALGLVSAGTLYVAEVSAITTAGCTITVFTRDGSNQSATIPVNWIALGQAA